MRSYFTPKNILPQSISMDSSVSCGVRTCFVFENKFFLVIQNGHILEKETLLISNIVIFGRLSVFLWPLYPFRSLGLTLVGLGIKF